MDTAWRYESLANALEARMNEGTWRPGERLPSIRQLAASQGLSISTIQHALRLLEQRGRVLARPQSGYYVCPPHQGEAPRMSQPSAEATPVRLTNDLLRVVEAGGRPGVAPLTAAFPGPDLLPLAALHRLYASVARTQAPLTLGGHHTQLNDPELVRALVRRAMSHGTALDPNEIVVTQSCTEALAMCLRAVTQPGDTVAVESPAYYLMLQLLESLGLKALEIPCDPVSGMSIDALELATREGRVQACLVVANASNPLGSIMPEAHKARLAALAAERGLPVIEDDIYGDLHFTGDRPRPIKAFDNSGQVMLCASFSKSLSPALRIGYVAAGRRHPAVALLKTIGSGGNNPVTQRVLATYLASGAYVRHLHALRRHYGRQVDAMRQAVRQHFPEGTRMSSPQGGFVLWIELPAGIDTSALHAEAIAAGVGYVPGALFSPGGLYRNCLRLSCGQPHSAAIEAAVATLGRLCRQADRS